MLLNNPILTCDADKRKLYVAITRAKSKLHIHYTGNVFDAYIPYATEYFLDSTIYNKPSEIIMQFSYKDVHLDFFKDKKDLILKKLSSGYLLEIRGKYLYFRNNKKVYPHPVMKLSSQGYEKVQNAMRSGYHPYLAKIRFIVSWKSPDDGLEYAIILPNIYFRLC
jgi:ATP-dependent DNA helicase RecQ